MTKWLIVIVLIIFGVGVLILLNRKTTPPQTFSGCELTITCKGDVEETIYVQVISGGLVENFGVVGAGPNGRDGGKTTGFGPFKIGEEVTVQWGVDGEDGLNMLHSKVFDTRKYLPYVDQVRAVEFIFHGGDNWEMKAYDANISDENKTEILPDPHTP